MEALIHTSKNLAFFILRWSPSCLRMKTFLSQRTQGKDQALAMLLWRSKVPPGGQVAMGGHHTWRAVGQAGGPLVPQCLGKSSLTTVGSRRTGRDRVVMVAATKETSRGGETSAGGTWAEASCVAPWLEGSTGRKTPRPPPECEKSLRRREGPQSHCPALRHLLPSALRSPPGSWQRSEAGLGRKNLWPQPTYSHSLESKSDGERRPKELRLPKPSLEYVLPGGSAALGGDGRGGAPRPWGTCSSL